jgi:hypothetical protein
MNRRVTVPKIEEAGQKKNQRNKDQANIYREEMRKSQNKPPVFRSPRSAAETRQGKQQQKAKKQVEITLTLK